MGKYGTGQDAGRGWEGLGQASSRRDSVWDASGGEHHTSVGPEQTLGRGEFGLYAPSCVSLTRADSALGMRPWQEAVAPPHRP